ncbi:hypothetical protein Dtox_4121 [Desulfofarcimen acetoxidans DSM 771]|uniref:Uncharacterized protein n=1 Tax=Desulfofarcimen acetoxidans (strain ATCC 49208 / DSM 771 / KCTC 5769 / VKM B-1644 / 5575) TaxID=485916 RepID=C8VYS0_DESAS|nr:hypothetical protein [Desulfofarcimen acetoxidans]ACV64791.1 hypothetical protein Dtox_4121 [Desulfofarcimen acetoxidans DSM 771]
MLKKKIIIAAISLAGITLCGYAVFADAPVTGSPGSDSDPLVTKSYVEKYVGDFFKGTAGDWQTTQLTPGQVFSCDAGAEFIVRSGKAVTVDSTGSGIPDLTDGTNILSGQAVPKNHLCIVPRSDGRGVKAVDTVWVMHKGSVNVK